MNKSEIARKLRASGVPLPKISADLNMPIGSIKAALGRKSKEEAREAQKAATRALKPPLRNAKHMHVHSLVQPFKRPEPPRGSCTAWTVVEGEAVQCGKPCKGQLCADHTHTTLPIGNTLGRRAFA